MPNEERLARRERARRAGRKAATPPRRTSDQEVRREPSVQQDPPRVIPPGASVSPQEERVPATRTKSAKVVVPETVTEQVARQVASVQAAEAKRRGAAVVPAQRTRAKSPQVAPVPAPVEPQELGEAIKGLRPEFVQCRDYLHAWRPFTCQWMPSFNVYEAREQCMRCGTIRVREMDRRGHVLARRYEYPEGYSMKGYGRLSGDDRDAIRLASIMNLTSAKEKKHA